MLYVDAARVLLNIIELTDLTPKTGQFCAYESQTTVHDDYDK